MAWLLRRRDFLRTVQGCLAALAVAPSPPKNIRVNGKKMPNLPTLPQLTIDTTYPTVTGSTITVNSGGNLQTAINTAAAADGNLTHEIVVQAGATFTIAAETLALRAKSGANPSGTGWIIIRSSALGSLPTQGTRVSPTDVTNMPKLQTTNAAGPFWIGADFGAHHYWFAGIEFAHAYTATAGIATAIIQLGYDMNGNQATTIANLTKNFTFDRCYVHGTTTGNIIRGIAANVQSLAVVDSYFDEFHVVGSDSQCLSCWNGPGPIKLDNNYFAAAGENVLFGGSPNAISNAPLENITVTRNYFKKYLKWKQNDPSYAGIHWSVKNLFELKQGSKVLIEGNIFENNWVAGQAGHCVVFTPREDSPPAAATTPSVQDITFRYNIIRHGSSAFNLLGKDNNGSSLQLARLHIHDSLSYDMDGTVWRESSGNAINGMFIRGFFSGTTALGTGVKDATIEHNTSIHTNAIAITDVGGPPNTRIMEALTWLNNITPKRSSGFFGAGTSDGETTLDTYFTSDVVFTGNVMAGGNSADYSPNYLGNFFPANDAAVGFTDQANNNYRLLVSSTFHNAGTDGTDPGPDFDTLEGSTHGVGKLGSGENNYSAVTGVWGTQPPPPPPPPPAAASPLFLWWVS